jgi:hypothetical protein
VAIEPAAPGDLARALAPLYYAYRRRLDEMAARVPDGLVLREAITRAEDGTILLGDDGLPLRFDVANAHTLETYAVWGSIPDEPAARELKLGRLDVRLAPGNWENLPVTCVFDGAPLEDDAAALGWIMQSWAHLAAHRAFTEEMLGSPWSGRLHSFRVQMSGNLVTGVFDLGSCPPIGVEMLVKAFEGFCDRVPIARVEIGGPIPEMPVVDPGPGVAVLPAV